MKHVGLASILALLAAPPTHAQSYCGGASPPTRVLTYSDGGLMVLMSWRADWVQICNLNETWKSMTSSVCFGWMSTLTSAIADNQPIHIFYNEPGPNFCATVPTYGNAPAPRYIAIGQQP